MYDKVEVWWDSNNFPYRENGLAFYVRYIGKNEPVGLAYITSGVDSPLTGDNLTAYSNVTKPYGENLFYEAIPFEMLRTIEHEP